MTDINGFNSNDVSAIVGLETDTTTTSLINLTNNQLILNSGNNIISILDNLDMNNNNIINSPDINKLQNINNVSENITNVKGLLNLGPLLTNPINIPLTNNTISEFVASGAASYGFKFTLLKPITINRIGHAVLAWPVPSVTSSNVRIYSEGNTTPIYSYTLLRTNVYFGYYVLNITPITLPIGTYRFSIGLINGQSFYNNIFKPYSFDTDVFSLVEGALTANLNGAYPESTTFDIDFIFGGYFWYTTTFSNQIITPSIKTNILSSSTSNILIKNEIDMNNNNIINCNSINNLRITGGVWLATSSGPIITATNTELSLFTGVLSLGSLFVSANTFTVSAYHLNISGNFSSNGNNLNIRLKTDSIILADMPLILTNSVSEHFELEVDFVIRKLGTAGVAILSTNFDFTYSDGDTTNFRGDRICLLNTTTFNTTIDNTLNITAQFQTITTANSIQMIQGVLTKIF